MLIAEFSHKGEEIEIDDALWQHDYGQKIQIKGLDLPEVFEVHFAWKDIEKAKVVTGSTIDGVSTVDIPNVALEQRRAITAYVYLSNAVEGETVNTILMTVNKRKAPKFRKKLICFITLLKQLRNISVRRKSQKNGRPAYRQTQKPGHMAGKIIQTMHRIMRNIMQNRPQRVPRKFQERQNRQRKTLRQPGSGQSAQ